MSSSLVEAVININNTGSLPGDDIQSHPLSEWWVGVGSGTHQQRTQLLTPPASTLPKVDTNCTAPSLIPTVNGNTVRSFPTHEHQSAAKGSSTAVSRSDIRLIKLFDFGSVV